MTYRPLTLAIAALFTWPALAADPVTTTFGEIIVTAPKEAGNQVSKEAINTAKPSTSDTASLLQDVPGISLYDAGGISSLPAIHGLADDRVRIKVDGMDLIASCPNHMNPALSYIDSSKVDSIKVYAGVTPVSVGGDSVGGSIVVESAKPKFAKPGEGLLTQGELGAFYRSNGSARGANLTVSAANDKASVTYTGSVAKSGNYVAGGDFKTSTVTGRAGHILPLDEVGSSAYKTTNNALDMAFRNDRHEFDLSLRHQSVPYENYPNQRMDMTGNESDQIKLGYSGQFDWGLLNASAYRELTNHEMDFGIDKRFYYGGSNPPLVGSGGVLGYDGLGNGFACSPVSMSCAWGMPMYTKGKTDGLSVKADLPLSEQDTLRLGVEYQAYRLDDWWPPSGAGMWPGTFWNISDGERDRLALFGEWEKDFSAQWQGLLGLRHEKVDMDAGDVVGYNTTAMAMGNQYRDMNAFNALDHNKSDNNWDLTAMARFTPDARQTYEAGLSQKTRSPNLYERYTWSTWSMAAVMNNFVGDGNGYIGNIDLKPETARTLSLSANWHDAAKQDWEVQATPYYTHVQDFINAVQWNATANAAATTLTTNQFVVLKYVNQSAELYGIDLSGRYQFIKSGEYGNFTLSGVMNYVRGHNRANGDNLYNIMPFNTKLAVTQRVGNWTHVFEAQYVGAKESVSRMRNEIQTDSYNLFNVRTSYATKQWRVDVGIENLLDTAYDLPLGGAYTGQGTTMTLYNATVMPWGIAVPGQGRSMYVGVNFKF